MAKKTFLRHSFTVVAGIAFLLALAAYSGAKQTQSKKTDSAAKPAASESSDSGNSIKFDAVKDGKQTAPMYWIGVRCVAPIPEMVLAHVKTPENSGVYVVDVVPDGPAAKTGIARHDIILSIADTPLHKVSDLVSAVSRSQGKPIAMEIIRKGQKQSVDITPAARPAKFASRGELDMPKGSKWHELGKWFDENLPGLDDRPPLRMRFMHPGVILPPGARGQSFLPEDMTVTITREGDGPAQIVVKRNNDTWKLNENDIDKLPADIRPHVARMLGRISMPAPTAEDIRRAFGSYFQEQLEAIDLQMSQLQKMTEDLKRERMIFERHKDTIDATDREIIESEKQ